VTKLSLLLKLLEDENQETVGKTLALFQERVLPSLENNIKCGNSLIGPDFYNFQTPPIPNPTPPIPLFSKEGEPKAGAFEDADIRRINVFDWEKEFPEIMKSGGFDAVIGNPPYVRQEMLGEFKPYFQSHYKTYHGVADLYVYFIEKAVSLLNEGGHFSYIVANKWMRANYGAPLRRWMKGQGIEEIVDFGDLPVFQTATTYPCILRISKPVGAALRGRPDFKEGQPHRVAPTMHVTRIKTLDFPNLHEYINEHHYEVSRTALDDSGWSLSGGDEEAILAKIKAAGVPLGEYVKGKIYRGVLTGLNEAFVIDADRRNRLIAEDPKSEELIKPFLVGRDVKRYCINNEGRYLILIPKGWTRQTSGNVSDTWKWFKQNYTAIADHLLPFNDKAEKRYDKGEYWWELRACDYYGEFERPKIVIPAIVSGASYTFDDKGFYSNDKTSIISTDDKYLLGLLNSKVLEFFMHSISSTKQGGYYEYKPMYVSQLPIVPVADKAQHDKMVSLVDRMLDLNKKLQSARIAHEKELLDRQIKITDEQIDRLVYELYGLTEEERKIIES